MATDVKLPSECERRLRAAWFSTLTDDQRAAMVAWPFDWVEVTFAAWVERRAPAGELCHR